MSVKDKPNTEDLEVLRIPTECTTRVKIVSLFDYEGVDEKSFAFLL